MTQITNDHAEWAVVGRLRRMLEGEPHPDFNVTQTYALFTTILCWVVQRLRIRSHEIASADDRAAHKLFQSLSKAAITDDPWQVHVTATRIAQVEGSSISVPAPLNFETHTADRFLINLRDATAHGDARNVTPFNPLIGSVHKLVGFEFACAEFNDPKGRKQNTWNGQIILLETDMRRIGAALANCYCDALRHSKAHRGDSQFGHDAASIKEVAA